MRGFCLCAPRSLFFALITELLSSSVSDTDVATAIWEDGQCAPVLRIPARAIPVGVVQGDTWVVQASSASVDILDFVPHTLVAL